MPLAMLAAALVAATQPMPLKPDMAGLQFLVGDWSSGRGQVADTGERATGSSTFSVEAGGAVLLRRDQTALTDAKGKPSGVFGQIMMIYPEAGALHADYSDGTHVIHYASAHVTPGHAVIFQTAPTASAPAFRLTYTLKAPTTLEVAFAMAPPGAADFHPIATGDLSRGR